MGHYHINLLTTFAVCALDTAPVPDPGTWTVDMSADRETIGVVGVVDSIAEATGLFGSSVNY